MSGKPSTKTGTGSTPVALKERANRLKVEIPTVFLSMKDRQTPVIAKVFAAVTVAYALSPIDLIPDFIPVLGYLDDLILLPALVALTLKFIPKAVYEKNHKLAEGLWDNGKPKKWYYSIPIILFWVFIFAVIIKAIMY